MMNFQDKLQTTAPSIRYEGDIRPEQAQLRQQQAQAMAGPSGIAGLNMPGYAEGGDVENDPNYKGWKKLYEKNKDVAAMNENHKKYLDHYNRTPKAYGGIMGQDGRRQYGIGSWFQENIMDPIKNNPKTSAVIGGALLNQFGIPFTGTPGNRMGQNFIGNLLGGRDAVLGAGGGDGEKLINLGEIMKARDPSKPDAKTPFGLSTGMLSAIGGGVAGLFADKIDTPENIEPDYGTGIGIRNVGQAANILDPKQGMAAGLRFLPELSTRKYSPAEMLTQYGAVNEPLATANLAEGGAAFQRSSTDISTSIQMLVRRLQEINAAMVGAEMEEVLPMMREALQIRDKIQELGSSAPQDIGMEAEGIKDMIQQASYSAPEASGPKIFSAGEMLSNTNLGLGRDETINEEIISDIVNQGTGAGIPMAANVESTSQKFDPRLMRAAMMRRPSGKAEESVSIEDILRGTDTRGYAEGGGIGSMMEEQSEMLDLGGMEKDYREEGGFVPIGEYEKKDDVPARLSVNEFVFTADAVRGAGDGDIDKGAERLQGIMKELEKQGKPEGMEMMEVSERLSEVV